MTDPTPTLAPECMEKVLEALPAYVHAYEMMKVALTRLEAAADPYLAEQGSAPDPRVGNVQPITVKQGRELASACNQASAALSLAESTDTLAPALAASVAMGKGRP